MLQIEYAKSNMGSAKDTVKDKMEDAQAKMSSLWTEITAEEDEDEEAEVPDVGSIALSPLYFFWNKYTSTCEIIIVWIQTNYNLVLENVKW